MSEVDNIKLTDNEFTDVKILGGSLCRGTPVFFSNRHGFISFEPVDDING